MKAFSFRDEPRLSKALPSEALIYSDKVFGLSELNVTSMMLNVGMAWFLQLRAQTAHIAEQLEASFPQAGVLLHTPMAFV